MIDAQELWIAFISFYYHMVSPRDPAGCLDLLNSVLPVLRGQFRWGPAFVPHAAAAHSEGLTE